MGRWAQQRRRGGSPPVAASGLTILTVEATDASHYTATFSSLITYDTSGLLTGFSVNGNAADDITQSSPTQLLMEFGAGASSGQAWALASVPPQVTPTVAAPQSGLTI